MSYFLASTLSFKAIKDESNVQYMRNQFLCELLQKIGYKKYRLQIQNVYLKRVA